MDPFKVHGAHYGESKMVHMIRKGRVKWLAKGDATGQALLIPWLFGLAA